jgi:hypothetical protein
MKIVKNKDGQRYILSNNKRYKLDSNIHDKDLANESVLIELRNLIKVLKNKKKKTKKKRLRESTNTAVIPGEVTVIRGTLDANNENAEEAVRNLGVQLSHNVVVMKREEIKKLKEVMKNKKDEPLKIGDAIKLLGHGKKSKKIKKKKKKRAKKLIQRQHDVILQQPATQQVNTSPGPDISQLLLMMQQQNTKGKREIPEKGLVNVINDVGDLQTIDEGNFRGLLHSAKIATQLNDEVDRLTQIKIELDVDKAMLEQDKINLKDEKKTLTNKIKEGEKYVKRQEDRIKQIQDDHILKIDEMKNASNKVKQEIEHDFKEKVKQIQGDINMMTDALGERQKELKIANDKIINVEASNKNLEETKIRVEESKAELEKILKGLQLKNDLEKDLRTMNKEDTKNEKGDEIEGIISLARRHGLLKSRENYIEQILNDVDEYDWDKITKFSKKILKPKGMTYVKDTPARRSKIRSALSDKLANMDEEDLLNFAKNEKIKIDKDKKSELTQPKIIQKILNDDKLTMEIAKERGHDIDDIILPEDRERKKDHEEIKKIEDQEAEKNEEIKKLEVDIEKKKKRQRLPKQIIEYEKDRKEKERLNKEKAIKEGYDLVSEIKKTFHAGDLKKLKEKFKEKYNIDYDSDIGKDIVKQINEEENKKLDEAYKIIINIKESDDKEVVNKLKEDFKELTGMLYNSDKGQEFRMKAYTVKRFLLPKAINKISEAEAEELLEKVDDYLKINEKRLKNMEYINKNKKVIDIVENIEKAKNEGSKNRQDKYKEQFKKILGFSYESEDGERYIRFANKKKMTASEEEEYNAVQREKTRLDEIIYDLNERKEGRHVKGNIQNEKINDDDKKETGKMEMSGEMMQETRKKNKEKGKLKMTEEELEEFNKKEAEILALQEEAERKEEEPLEAQREAIKKQELLSNDPMYIFEMQEKYFGFPEEDFEKIAMGKHAGKIGDSSGLWTDEIEKIMNENKKDGWKGVYDINKINDIQFNPDDKSISFIVFIPGDGNMGHWVAVYLNRKNIEYDDSFGEAPPSKLMKQLTKLVKRWEPIKLMQFKINTLKRQRNNSNNCGYFAIQFLKDRYKGKTFKKSTGFKILEDSIRGERNIKKFKKSLKPFNLI